MEELLAHYSQLPPIEQSRFLALLVTNEGIMAGADAVIAFSEKTGIAIDDTSRFYAALAATGASLGG